MYIEILSIKGSKDLEKVFIELGLAVDGINKNKTQSKGLHGSSNVFYYIIKHKKLSAYGTSNNCRVTESVAEFRAFLIQYFKLEGFSLLPSYFVIRWSKEPRWGDYITYLNGRTIGGGFLDGHSKNCYYGIDKEGSFTVSRLSELKEKPLELTLDQFFEFTEEETSDWYIRGCKELAEWQMKVMNDKCNVYLSDTGKIYYTDDAKLLKWTYSYVIPKDLTEITFKEFKRKIKNKQKTREMKEVTVKKLDLGKIHEIACPDWKTKIVSLTTRNPFGDSVELARIEINEMFKAATPTQLPVLEEIFGKQDKSVDLSNFKLTRKILDVRDSGEFDNKAFYLSNLYDWEIKKDKEGLTVLIPTLK
jgi:hypothetical protein